MKAALALAVALAALLALAPSAAAYEVREARLTVYRDGVVHVRVVVAAGELEPDVTIPLLSSSVTNVLAVDEGGRPLYYEVADSNVTVYSLGATEVTLEYDTDALTRKEEGLWTVSFVAPFSLDLTLPENATIIYLSSAPERVRTTDGRITLTLSRGSWEVSYEVPIAAPPPAPAAPSRPPLSYLLALLTVPVVMAIAIAAILRRRGARAISSREGEVLSFLRRRGGRALEAEIREAFPHVPKTTMWRMLKRLEKEGKVRIRKVGLQNLVELS
ncbi:MAG: hypothetical protein QXT74_05985 [Candidatus Nezhaarchaeales archaeon]